jgi:hypothetical protein
MDYNNRLINVINTKFSLDVIKYFEVIGNNNFFMDSSIGKRLKELFDNFNNEYKKIINNDLNFEYYLDGIHKNIYLKQNHKILNNQIIDLMIEENNINLRNSFEEIINYINSLPYIDNDNYFNNEFIKTFNMITEISNDENSNMIDLESNINFLLNYLKNKKYIKLQCNLSKDYNIDNVEKLKKNFNINGFEIYKNKSRNRNQQYFEYIFCDKLKNANDLLKKYNNDIKILKITNKNIEGILDLSKFKYLEELDCSNNNISDIINIQDSLKYLNCSNNKITSLLNLPDEMTGINCKSNPLKELYYPFNIKPKKYPSNLTHLTFGKKFNQSIDNLPNSLTHLIFNSIDGDFNQSMDNLPESITHIILSKKYNKPLDNLPLSLINLQTGYSYNYPLDNLPNSLNKLTIGNNGKWGGSVFNYQLDNLPNSLEYLGFTNYSKFNKTFKNLPSSLKTIDLSGYYPISINELPDTIENIFLNCAEDFSEDCANPPRCCKNKIKKLPKNIKRITIREMDEIIDLDFSDLKKLHKEINDVRYSW